MSSADYNPVIDVRPRWLGCTCSSSGKDRTMKRMTNRVALLLTLPRTDQTPDAWHGAGRGKGAGLPFRK